MGRLTLGATSAATVILALAALSACSSGAVRDDNGDVTQGGDTDVFSLQVGDCFNDTAADEVSSVPIVPCTESHDNEVFFEFSMPDGDYPSDDEFQAAATEQCDPVFASFIGVDYNDSDLDYAWMTPTSDGWSSLNDRVVQCVVYDPNGQVTGSLKGSAR